MSFKINTPIGVLVLSTLSYLVNFIDRAILNILFAPIKNEFHFSDLELAILSSTSFIIFYSVLSIYSGRLADKLSNKNLAAIGILIWCTATGLIYFTTGFYSIAICRIFVGIGQALFFPSVIAILSNSFEESKRGTAIGIFSMSIAVGAGISYLAGGVIAENFGWRNVFLFLGFPGIIFTFLFFMVEENKKENKNKIESVNIFRLLKSKRFIFHLIGYAFFAVNSNSLLIWMPTYFMRVENYTLSEAGKLIGILLIIFGGTGTILGGFLADKFNKNKNFGRMLYSGILSLSSLFFWIGLLFSESPVIKITSLAILVFILFGWFGAAVSDLSKIFPIHQIGIATGIYLFVINILGNGIAPPLYGAINDYFFNASNPNTIIYSLLLSPISAIISSVFLIFGSKLKD